ncbi:MAG: hypothetical protein KAQ75_00900, partial [Bacteroidales bacterium]|nr:hypothetical protein [Bacteroidales bacterium]
LDQNKKTYNEVKDWIKSHEDSSLRFFVINEQSLPNKFAGAGLARKIGMDQAIYRFNQLNKHNGIIVSIDADSKIQSNYFLELENHFIKYPKTNAITTYFEHAIDGDEFTKEVYDAIIIYELYLRYYKQALNYTGFPYSYYTIGSCFAVNANTYVKQGGMNRKQAGEDFYFLHKIFPLGMCYEINSTCVHPSSRPSDRVPFGTGPMVKSIIDLRNEDFLTYNFDSFLELKSFFNVVNDLFRISENKLDELLKKLPDSISEFLKINEIYSAVREINENSANIRTFTKRFFDWFNAFRVLKYLNFAHEKHYEKQSLLHEAEKLLQSLEVKTGIEKIHKNYLGIFRNLEKQ